jgi:type III restriction enzyme
VNNLYTIIPLRAANAHTLIEQSIGRGLRLPYGTRTGVPAVDRLNIVAHDRFQEIVDEDNKPGSVIRLTQVIIEPEDVARKISIVSESNMTAMLGISSAATVATNRQRESSDSVMGISVDQTPVAFKTLSEQAIAQLTYKTIQGLESQPDIVPATGALQSVEVQRIVKDKVEAQYKVAQLGIEGITDKPDIASVVAKTTELFTQQIIDIPRIVVVVVPTGEVKTGIHPFSLDLSGLNYPPPSEEMWIQSLQTGEREVLSLGEGNISVSRLEDYVVMGLVDFDDISYYRYAPADKSKMSTHLFGGFAKYLYPIQKFDSNSERLLERFAE